MTKVAVAKCSTAYGKLKQYFLERIFITNSFINRYPHESLNLPLLGIDLLAFGGMKFLAVVDFHPLYDDEKEHSKVFDESILKPIRDKYPSLQGKMSAKFYDETQFFSKNMLF